MEVEFRLSKANLDEANRFFWQNVSGKGFNLKAFTISLLIVAVSVVAVFYIAGYWSLIGFLLGAVLALGLVLAFIKTAPKRFQPNNPNGVFARQKLAAGKEGVTIKRDFKSEQIKWGYFLAFEETKNLFLLLVEPNQAVIVPKAAFEKSKADDFRKLCRENIPTSS